LRVYGYHTELLINRKNELQNIIELYKKGFGPKLYGTFTNGYVYQYFDGKALTPEELSNSKYIQKIGSFLGKWHRQEIIGEKISTCWEKIEEWLDLVPESYNNEEKDKKIRQLGGLCKLKKELKNLKNSLSKINSPIVFTHNDLLSGNVIFNEKNDSIYFIDFEYSGYNYRGYDIANHFNEWAGFNVDYSKYPNKEQQYEFFRSYLKSFNQTEEEPNEHELNNLYKEVNKFSLVFFIK
jgi:ethanolamine kinase